MKISYFNDIYIYSGQLGHITNWLYYNRGKRNNLFGYGKTYVYTCVLNIIHGSYTPPLYYVRLADAFYFYAQKWIYSAKHYSL